MEDKRRYLRVVEWSNEDDCYVGSIPGWIGKCCHGDDEEKVYHQLTQILDEWIEIYKKDKLPLPSDLLNREFSGKFQLRIDKELHKLLAIRAKQKNESLNSLCIDIFKEKLVGIKSHF